MSKINHDEPRPAGQSARILVVDDHPLVRAGLAQLISEHPGLVCCGQADTAAAALAAVPALQPHLVTVDLRLKDGDGLSLLKDLKLRHPALPSSSPSLSPAGILRFRCGQRSSEGMASTGTWV